MSEDDDRSKIDTHPKSSSTTSITPSADPIREHAAIMNGENSMERVEPADKDDGMIVAEEEDKLVDRKGDPKIQQNDDNSTTGAETTGPTTCIEKNNENSLTKEQQEKTTENKLNGNKSEEAPTVLPIDECDAPSSANTATTTKQDAQHSASTTFSAHHNDENGEASAPTPAPSPAPTTTTTTGQSDEIKTTIKNNSNKNSSSISPSMVIDSSSGESLQHGKENDKQPGNEDSPQQQHKHAVNALIPQRSDNESKVLQMETKAVGQETKKVQEGGQMIASLPESSPNKRGENDGKENGHDVQSHTNNMREAARASGSNTGRESRPNPSTTNKDSTQQQQQEQEQQQHQQQDEEKTNPPRESGTSSPILIEDEGLMKTDEQLPPYDFGSPKVESDDQIMNLPGSARSSLPNHIKFLADRGLLDKTLPEWKTHVPALSAEQQEGGAATTGKALGPTNKVDTKKEQIKARLPPPVKPATGTEEYILQQRPQRLKAKQAAASKARSSRHSHQRQASQQSTHQQKVTKVRQPSKPAAALKVQGQTTAAARQLKPPPASTPASASASAAASAPPPSSADKQTSSQKASIANQTQHNGVSKPAPAHEDSQIAPQGNQYYPPAAGAKYRYPYRHQGRPSTAATKPTRRLAKIRPYANQSTPVSAEEIRRAIPTDASAVFHVMDRRINLDAFEVDEMSGDLKVPVYSLLRAWVQDDPYRQIPPPPITLPTIQADSSSKQHFKLEEEEENGNHSVPPTTKKRDRDELNNNSDHYNMTKKPKAKVDMIGYLQKSQSSPSLAGLSMKAPPTIDTLKLELVQEAKQKKMKKSESYKRTLAKTLKSLRERGIVQGQE